MRHRAIGVVNEMNVDVYVSVRCHASWLYPVQKVSASENLMVNGYVKQCGTCDWHDRAVAGRREGVIG